MDRRNPNDRRRNNGNEDTNDGVGWGWILGAAAIGTAAAGVGVYLATRPNEMEDVVGYPDDDGEVEDRKMVSESLVMSTPLANMNGLIDEIYKRYIKLKDYEFQLHFNVVDNILKQLRNTMTQKSPYFNRYSQKVYYVGSFAEKLRVAKPDEFDVNFTIGVPVNMDENPMDPNSSDIVIEHQSPGFVKLKAGKQFQRLPKKLDEWKINHECWDWMDDDKYLRRTEFSAWFQKVVDLALNDYKYNTTDGPRHLFEVDSVKYQVRRYHNGPAITLCVSDGLKFKVDIDLVPGLRFHERRWLASKFRGYREIPPGCGAEEPYWLVVPKLNKNTTQDVNKEEGVLSWRVCLYEQERKLLYGKDQMKPAIRLVKKVRDVTGMSGVASYYIKTLFFEEIMKKDRRYWSDNSYVHIFKIMIVKLYEALVNRRIDYFWHPQNNLLQSVSANKLMVYQQKLKPLVEILNTSQNYKEVARFLLTPEEQEDFRFNVPDFQSCITQ